jgi:phosphatidylinositol-3-phosphatase
MLERTLSLLGIASLTAALAGTMSASATAAPSPRADAPRIRHVFIIVLENKNYDDTFKASAQDPYLSKTLPTMGATLTRYYGTGHFSLDNYLSMISGQASSKATEADCEEFSDFRLQRVDGDGEAVGTGCVYPAQIKTLADQLQGAGLSWKGYMEDMGNDPARERPACGHPTLNGKDPTQAAEAPRPGVPAGDQYAARHDPFVYFHSIIDTPACAANVVNLEALPKDLESLRTTPNFSFITPNLCNDGHDGDGTGAPGKGCADGRPGGLASTDAFLRTWVPRILGSPAYRKDGLLIITFDEGDFTPPVTHTDPATGMTTVTTSAKGEYCCGQKIGPNVERPIVQTYVESPTVTDLVKIESYGGDRIGAILLSPYIKPGTVSDISYNHYSLLRSLEDIYGVGHLGYAAQDGLATFGRDIFNDRRTE